MSVYYSVVWQVHSNTIGNKNKVVLKKLQNLLNYVRV